MKTMRILRSFLAWLLIVAVCCAVGMLAGALVFCTFHSGQAAASVSLFGTLLLFVLSGACD